MTACLILILIEAIVCGGTLPQPQPQHCPDIYDPYCQPHWEQIPLHVTSFNVWLGCPEHVATEHCIMLESWHGQCDSDCRFTAIGTRIRPYHENVIAACPAAWTTRGWTTGIMITGIGLVRCQDTFGNLAYRNGAFFHEGRGHWVFGVDILSRTPLYFVEWQWSKKRVRVVE